ncbi:hypothetical protein DRB17_19280 [Ferruginivarius sediminum]|uniref:Terminase large subunit gp17-like C-terminal domain-containing protein n=2 Tax=Ferruginivarius sediminum TaxID=2661937 RepID=A0A369T7Q2_9PROT|nr:hypothetical protein DRB17_19280 [Ferruginivarius sediminum]
MPRLHARMARWLEEAWQGGERELLLMAFRSAGKSTIVGLFCAWLLGRDPSLRILVLAADQALAVKMVRNVKRIVERHAFLERLKPERLDQWASDRFTVERPHELRDPSMLARGIGANITGSRADVVICDDVEVPNTCETAEKRTDLRERLAEIDYVLVSGGMQLYVGTPHTYYTIYAGTPRTDAGEEQPFLAGFRRLELPLLEGDGTSAWPERFPPRQIESMRRRSGPNKFASQMLLQPVNIADGRLDPDKLVFYDGELDYAEGNREAVLTLAGRRLVSASCWWDPSYGSPRGGDGSVIAAVFVDGEGRYYLHRIAYLTHDSAKLAEVDEATQQCRAAARFARSLYLPCITLETNGLGRFLPGLLRRELSAMGVPCAVREIATHRSKDVRILEAFDAPLAAGALHAHRGIRETPFLREMREWRPGATGVRDDGLDAVAGCLFTEPVRLPRQASSGRWNWRPGAGGISAPSDFEV